MAATPVAVVTGTARAGGIGRAVARAFITKQFKVVGVDVAPAEALDVESSEFRTSYHHHICDVSSEAQVATVWDAAVANFGTTDGGDTPLVLKALVNNAAIVDPAMPSSSDPIARIKRWRSVLDVNLTGSFLMCETLVPHMPPNSVIINVSSTRAIMSEPNTEAYSASKAGLLGLTHALSQSLAPKGIRVNAVLPGWIDTEGGEGLRPEDHKWHAAGRVGRPDDVAAMCAFLAGPGAEFITGQELVVDGGVTKKMVY